MVAALSMYDMPHQVSANDEIWRSIRGELGFGPEFLSRGIDPWAVWTSPDLVLSQTCGLPFRARLHGRVQLVGTPNYGIPGCQPGFYYSVLVAAKNGPAHLSGFDEIRFAFNDGLSQSGWGAPQQVLRGLGVPITRLPPTQSHRNSALAVANGHADLAAIDVVTWTHLGRSQPAVTNALRVIGQTTPTAGLPFITGRDQDRQAVAEAVERGVAKADGGARLALGLLGVVPISEAAYLSLPMPSPA